MKNVLNAIVHIIIGILTLSVMVVGFNHLGHATNGTSTVIITTLAIIAYIIIFCKKNGGEK